MAGVADFAEKASGAGIIVVLRLWNRGHDGGRNDRTFTYLRERLEGEWAENPAASSAMGRWYRAAWTVRASLTSEIYWMEAVRRWRIFCLHHGHRPW